MANMIASYSPEMLPPEMLLDEHHPANDAYIQNTRNIQRTIMAQQAKMPPKAVMAVKRHFAGQTNKVIAEEIKVNPGTVGKYINSEDGQRLLALLHHYQSAVEGPNEAQRRNLLWRVALVNEEGDPRVAIQAVGELNRMTMAEYSRKATTLPGQVTIVINQEAMPRGPLDQ